MAWIERLENFSKMALGASLAFYLCYYVWNFETAGNAGMLAGLIFAISYFWSRYLRNKTSVAAR
ncbi:hypothetical protein [Sphingopyxis sp. KK2]|uniref:hypothetical protein n=1 Tax=Sphingopyxis sp. KK2 TaxID=1855727 RepID=UPI0011819C52|nr:hypothetical protein [Sphingopyxis sp. KK2]